jgi:predicted transcriptional regulator of viral defense system
MIQSISARESELIDQIESRGMIFFRPKDVQRFLGVGDRASYNMLSRIKKKGLIERIQSGTYVLDSTLNSRDLYELASNLVDASYLGLFSALHFHDLTDQVPRKAQLVTTKRKNSVEIQGRELEFVTVKRDQFFGYRNYNSVVASTPEKTVIDCLRLIGKAGDISNIIEINYEELDVRLLVRYTEKTGSSSVASRLGYILDQKNVGFQEARLQKLITGYSLLDPKMDRGNPDNKWKLYVNREVE